MIAVVAGVLALVLVAGCGVVIGRGGVGDLVARLNPMAKLAVFGVVLVLVAATGWTLGSVVGPVGDQPVPSAPSGTGHGDSGHGG
ncbi:hypothetical protein [Actinophytocola oryzae]|uniref:Uncharacterized protein n=1 Tax=Actinophytocola oryzae TaxID=502181 RepID=A0A4R7V620_9PSEU|nr:hypothetical protein [Actinophytocola oryzae]TDV44264.1 hypothetical protein CLV71_114174 [Actinophytocola oryzae]